MAKFFASLGGYFKKTDKMFWLISLLISVYALLLIKSVTRAGGNFFTTQLIAIAIGYVGAVIISNMDYVELANSWILVAVVCLSLVVLTVFIGINVYGNKAWIRLPGGSTFQPAELMKIGFIITFSKHLSVLQEKDKIKSFLGVVGLGLHAAVPVGLVALVQKDTGTAIVFALMFLFMAFGAGVQLRYFIVLFGGLAAAAPFAWKFVLNQDQKNRVLSIFNPDADPLGIGFQQIQGRISIGSGGLFGRGLFDGPRVAKAIVPFQENDFIFSVAGEELGFIGCALLIVLLLLLLFRALRVSSLARDPIGKYICIGFFSMIAAQTIMNLGMCLGLLPVIGVTLPFFSAGGSSAACLYLGLGLVQSVYKHKENTERAGLRLHSIVR